MSPDDETIRFEGRVIELATGDGCANCAVVVSVPDGPILGQETTRPGPNGEGYFEIGIRRGDLRVGLDGQPILFVRVNQGRSTNVVYSDVANARWIGNDQILAILNVQQPQSDRLIRALQSVATKLPDPARGWPIDQQVIGALNDIAAKTPDPQERQQEQEHVIEALDDIAAYMPTGTEANGSGGHPSAGGGSHGDLQGVIDRELTAVLGGRWKMTEDAKPEGKSVLASLARSFPAVQFDGNTTYRFRPRAHVVHTELGGSVTGAQASIYRRAKDAIDVALPLLDALEPQESSGADDEDVAATRQIVRTELGELVNELGREGGPRVQRVDGIFTLLQKHFGDPAKPKKLGKLGRVFGLNRKRVTTIEEEQNFTNYLIIRDYVRGLASAWADRDRAQFLGGAGIKPFLGTQFYQLESTLTTAAEQVEETYRAMDAVGLGPAERRTVTIDFDGNFPALTADDLLSWVTQVTTDEWPQLIRDGGRDGVRAITPTAGTLRQLVDAAANGNPADLGHVGLTRERVRRKLRELASQLARIEDLAQGL